MAGRGSPLRRALPDPLQEKTGVAVLAWPEEVFPTYNALLRELGVQTSDHALKFFVASQCAGELRLRWQLGRYGEGI